VAVNSVVLCLFTNVYFDVRYRFLLQIWGKIIHFPLQVGELPWEDQGIHIKTHFGPRERIFVGVLLMLKPYTRVGFIPQIKSFSATVTRDIIQFAK
jgi:hypothetical protein